MLPIPGNKRCIALFVESTLALEKSTFSLLLRKMRSSLVLLIGCTGATGRLLTRERALPHMARERQDRVSSRFWDEAVPPLDEQRSKEVSRPETSRGAA